MIDETIIKKLEDLLRETVCGLIRFPEHLRIRKSVIPSCVVLNIQAHADDTPKIIGSGGATINAIGRVWDEIGIAQGRRVMVELSEPVFGEKQVQPPYMFNSKTTAEEFKSLLESISRMVWGDAVKVSVIDTGMDSSVFVVGIPNGELEEGMAMDLSVIFNGIGKANGRKLYVETNPMKSNDRDEQPTPGEE